MLNINNYNNINNKFITISNFSSSVDGKFIDTRYDGARVLIRLKDGFINASLLSQEGGEEKKKIFNTSFWQDLYGLLIYCNKQSFIFLL
jgi:hypothetical protein